jgi:hypothetical protein
MALLESILPTRRDAGLIGPCCQFLNCVTGDESGQATQSPRIIIHENMEFGKPISDLSLRTIACRHLFNVHRNVIEIQRRNAVM